ncbi:MAG: 2-dehydropantoate 2-reductase [Terriglobales bacterium]
MRTLVVGAGAIGGYFGGRLVEAKRDVTFLVRPRRAAELVRAGLTIRSRFGDLVIPEPKTVLAENLHDPYDLVLLSCKAFDLESAIEAFAPAVGSTTAILPLLNGMRHLDTLAQHFGDARVLGGQCLIAVAVNEKREIAHLNDFHDLSFGERDGTLSQRVKAIESLMEGVRFNARMSERILLEMWEKWVFLASAASSTCLMRAAVGDICASPGGTDYVLGVLEECRRIAAAEGYPMRDESFQRSRDMLTAAGSTLTASMLRDIERNGPIEADHIVGDLLARGRRHGISGSDSFLKVAYTHLKAYEFRRARTASQH